MRANSFSIKSLKYKPFILWFFSHRTTPSRYVMVTTNFATLPPDPQWEPFTVHPQASPSISFLQMRPRGARAWSAGLNLCIKLTASKKNAICSVHKLSLYSRLIFVQILIFFSDLYLLRDPFGMLLNTCILGYGETVVLFRRKHSLDWLLLAA